MDCTLITILACFNLSNLYVDASAEYLEQADREYTEAFYGETLHVFTTSGEEFIQKNVIRELSSPEREVVNPYLRGSLGYEVDMNGLRLDVATFYQESVRASDRGEFGASVSVRWFPFR